MPLTILLSEICKYLFAFLQETKLFSDKNIKLPGVTSEIVKNKCILNKNWIAKQFPQISFQLLQTMDFGA